MPDLFLEDPFDNRPFTFAEPSDGEPFSASLRNALSDFSTQHPTPAEVEAGTARFVSGFRAAERQMRLVNAFNASQEATAEAIDRRIDTVLRVTGVQLENPFRQGYFQEANRRVDEARARGEDIGPRGPRILEEQLRLFSEKLDDVAQNFPDKASALQFHQSLGEQARVIGAAAEQGNADAEGGFVAQLAGAIWGARRDPLFVTSFFAGPGLSQAAGAGARIAWSALKQGLYNAGLSALAQPTVQNWRREIGARNGLVPAIEDVGVAFLAGAIPGAGIQGAVELSRGAKAGLTRIAHGAPQPGDAELVAKELGSTIDDVTARTLRAAEAEPGLTHAAIGDAPAGVAPAEHTEIAAQALRHAEDPVHQPPPDIARALPPRPADQVKILDDARPAQIGEREVVDGKPVEFLTFNARELGTDATQFQFKSGGDAEGIINTLRGVTRWDPLASGKVFVFERADGTKIVADGHQRTGLARRLLDAGDESDIRLHGYLFREADGWTPADVRALAAKKNIQEGSGSPLDVARILRDRPDIMDGSLPVTHPALKAGMDLSRLSDEAFGMAVNGVVPPNYAAAVGAMVPDRLQHGAVIADLARFKPDTEREARVLIGEILSAGFRAEEQINLFGAAQATRSLMGERVKVLDRALQTLVADKKLFGTLAAKADAIEAAGNRLARNGNDTRARDAAALSDLLVRLAQRTGPVSDALNRAAATVAEGGKAGKAAEAFLDEVRAALDRDGLNGLLAAPELRPARVVEPGTPEATREAEAALASRSGPPMSGREAPATPLAGETNASPRTPQSQQTAFRDFISGQRGRSFDDLAASAKVLQGEIATAGEAVARETGALFVNPGPKRPERLAEKLARKDYTDAGEITDAARGGLIVETPAQADAAAVALARHFEVHDEGWKVGRTGYIDRKVLVRGADGTIGEVQIIPARMYEVKKGGGQKLYTAERSLPPGAEKEALLARSSELYSAATAELGAEWSGILERSSGPKSGSNVARQSASDMTPAVWATSEPSTSLHSPPGRVTAKAETPGSNTAGRQSQLQNVSDMERPSAENIGASRPADKPAEPSLFEAVAVAERGDGSDTRLVSHAAALEDADKTAFHADLVKTCKD